MVFESFAHVPVTEELLRHVWEGEPNGHQGGHRSGLGREGKTEFPAHWTPDIVENAIRTILEKPQFVGHYGNDIVLGSNFRGIMVVVKLKKLFHFLLVLIGPILFGVSVLPLFNKVVHFLFLME